MNFYLKNLKYIVLSAIVFFTIGFVSDRVFFKHNPQRSSCVSKLTLLKPNIDCESIDSASEKLSNLQNKIDVIIQGFERTNKIKRAGVFVRDLNTSRFAGVNDNDSYYMASLLKTPLMIGGFKLAEVEPKILDQEIVYNGTPNLYSNQVEKVGNQLILGQSYSIRDLIYRSIAYSDNTASQILFDFYPKEYMDRILQALGIQMTRPTGEVENFVTARTYANIFRILYNSSFLTKEYSNESLEILTKTQFNEGATSKIPKDVLVAHKFAERTLVGENNIVATRQFHECGIVYANKMKKPYIFCIMTEGNDNNNLKSVIADISLTIYNEMVKEE